MAKETFSARLDVRTLAACAEFLRQNGIYPRSLSHLVSLVVEGFQRSTGVKRVDTDGEAWVILQHNRIASDEVPEVDLSWLEEDEPVDLEDAVLEALKKSRKTT